MKYLILGTAGHIDHGKTSLVKALTGVDCDRLPEEKARGITIELGFANLEIPGKVRFGIVDVPGHERFVRTMVAGVAGMDIVMLVVAADEGVMPQTREHLDICQLLGVKRGLVALTKSDLVAPDWLDLVREELREYLHGSFLESAPILAVSSRTGAGLDALLQQLGKMAGEPVSRKSDGAFRLPIDRVFTVAGFGTIVTGTLLSGNIKVGDELEILSGGIKSRVRGIQSHGGRSEKGEAGERLAINLQGVDHSAVVRGDTVVPPDFYSASRTVDVLLNHLPSAAKGLKHRATLRLNSTTCETPAQLILLDRDSLLPGDACYAQLRLAKPALLLPGDPFVLRSYSPAATVGGGRVLDPAPPRRRRRSAEALALLAAAADGDHAAMVAGMISSSLLSGLTHAELVKRTGFSLKRLETILQPLLASGAIIQVTREPRIYLSEEAFSELKDYLCKVVEIFLLQNPLKKGIGREELKSRLPKRSDGRFFTALLGALEKEGKLLIEHDIVKLPGNPDEADRENSGISAQLELLLQQAGSEAPTLKELAENLQLPEKLLLGHLNLLAQEKKAVKVKSDIFHSLAAIETIRAKLIQFLKDHGEITPLQFREITGLSRKFMIPLLEYFDQEKLTIRVGDKRVLRRP
jgi:selenocysteine-specific elongation factor